MSTLASRFAIIESVFISMLVRLFAISFYFSFLSQGLCCILLEGLFLFSIIRGFALAVLS